MATQFVQAPCGAQTQTQQNQDLITNFFEEFFNEVPRAQPTQLVKQNSGTTEESEFNGIENLTTTDSEEVKFEPLIRKREIKQTQKQALKVPCPGCRITFWKLDKEHGICHNCVKIFDSV